MGLGCRWYGLGQEGRRHVPLAAIIGDDRDRLPVVTRQHTLDRTASLGLEDHPVANLEFEHLGVRPHLLQEAQTLDDPVIEVDEFRFGQFVNVDRHDFTCALPAARPTLGVTMLAIETGHEGSTHRCKARTGPRRPALEVTLRQRLPRAWKAARSVDT
jgi:hypothetical protein